VLATVAGASGRAAIGPGRASSGSARAAGAAASAGAWARVVGEVVMGLMVRSGPFRRRHQCWSWD